MLLRANRDADARVTLGVFRRAIQQTAGRDYSAEQVAVWASHDIDALDEWTAQRGAQITQVAELDGAVVGFTDVDDNGYIDMLYVDPAFGRRGVATALLRWAISTAHGRGATELSTHARVTARAIFEANGFAVVEKQHPMHRGVTFTNYRMIRPCDALPEPRS